MNVPDLVKAIETGFRKNRLRRKARFLILLDRRVDLINTLQRYVEKKEKTMHDQPVSGIHKFPPHEQHLYGATREDIKTALLLIDRIGRNSSEDPRGDASAAAELIRRGFKIDVDIQPPQRIIDAAWAIKTWAENHNLKNWQVAGIGPVDFRVQVPIGWTQTSNLVDDGFGHSFTVISSEPANATAEPYAPVYSEPVNAETIKAAAKEWCARACELEAQGCVARNNFVTAGALHSMAKLFREVNI